MGPSFRPETDNPSGGVAISDEKKEDRKVTSWFFLLLAGFFEIVWAVELKLSQGFTRPVPTIATIAAISLSMGCMALALKTIPMGTAYAVWTGIGAVGTVVVGMTLFGEPREALRLVCIGLIVIGIAGLKLTS
ncbi:MAG: multidrug efflux SMR transporter [Deltaproteobacteria bacterium]|nr:multidrug efflux SMR transporter [Deltaproteobacteria bacterium]MCL4872536.1 multidrug efflux SMR transporter [bacterium]